MQLLTVVGIAILSAGGYLVLFRTDDKKSRAKFLGLEFEVVGTGLAMVILGVFLLLIAPPRGLGDSPQTGVSGPDGTDTGVSYTQTEDPALPTAPSVTDSEDVEVSEYHIPTGQLLDQESSSGVESDSEFFRRALDSITAAQPASAP